MLNRIDAVPPTSRGAPCTMLSNVTGAQECDATDDDNSTVARNIKYVFCIGHYLSPSFGGVGEASIKG